VFKPAVRSRCFVEVAAGAWLSQGEAAADFTPRGQEFQHSIPLVSGEYLGKSLGGLVLTPFRRLITPVWPQEWCPEPRRLDAHATRRFAMKTNGLISTSGCLGLTCLKWRTDGELSAFDLRQVLVRLARVDRHVAAIWGNSLDLEPCPAIS
jgi:hypothetical protein